MMRTACKTELSGSIETTGDVIVTSPSFHDDAPIHLQTLARLSVGSLIHIARAAKAPPATDARKRPAPSLPPTA
jgi:hypothetical protein